MMYFETSMMLFLVFYQFLDKLDSIMMFNANNCDTVRFLKFLLVFCTELAAIE